MNDEKVTLTQEQEELILNAFQNPENGVRPSVMELTRLAFPNLDKVDGRTKEGIAVKVFLVERGLKANTKSVYVPVAKVELTDPQKEFIENNRANMTAVEMARILFNNQLLTNLNVETRTIAEHLRSQQTETDPAAAINNAHEVPMEDYRPPKTISGALQRVDKYVFNHGIDKDQMTAQQKAGLEALLGYLNTFRFINQINLYETQTARDLFESSFIRYTYDKPDLTEEEVDQFINVSHDNVAMAATQTRVETLSQLLDNGASQSSADDRVRISMGLVESIGALNTELNQIAKRQQALLGDLKQKRSDRIAQLRSANASILNLVQLWKEEKTRKKLIHLAEARKQMLEKATNELSGMEEIKARILGLDVNEVLHG